MWYFVWILGVLFASALAIVVSLWFEYREGTPSKQRRLK